MHFSSQIFFIYSLYIRHIFKYMNSCVCMASLNNLCDVFLCELTRIKWFYLPKIYKTYRTIWIFFWFTTTFVQKRKISQMLIASFIWTLCLQFLVLFGKAMKPLGVEEVCHWRCTLGVYSFILLPVLPFFTSYVAEMWPVTVLILALSFIMHYYSS